MLPTTGLTLERLALRKPSKKEKDMNATLLYRIAAFVFLLFALGHTYGFLSLRAPSAEARAVVRLDEHGAV